MVDGKTLSERAAAGLLVPRVPAEHSGLSNGHSGIRGTFLPFPGLPLLCTRASLLFLPSGAAIEDASKRQIFQNMPNSYAGGMTNSKACTYDGVCAKALAKET